MILSLLFLIASLSIFLILTEVLTIDIFYDENLILDLNFTIFAIRFTKSEHRSENNKKKRRRRNFTASSLFDIISPALNKCEVVLHHLNISLPADSPNKCVTRQYLYVSVISPVFAYVEAKSKKFSLNDITFDVSANNNYKISYRISFEISLIDFFTFFVLFRHRSHERRKLLWQKTK